jgi:spore maturation protein CgeB
MKYFEALACKTLLLAPTFPELEDLGFVPGEHFVAIDEQNFKEQAAFYLAHEAERERIAENGFQFIHQHHTVSVRAEKLVQQIKRIIREYNNR